jgi:transposase
LCLRTSLGRIFEELGYEVRLIPTIYVKAFVKRQENGANDVEAIAEASFRPTMRFVALKSAEQQAPAIVFKTRGLSVRQPRQIINALRGQLKEHSVIATAGMASVKSLIARIKNPEVDHPPLVVELARVHLNQLQICNERITLIERRLRDEARDDPETARLQTAPGIGPVSAMAIKAFAPPMEGLRRGRDYGAWLGVVPV